MRGKDLVTVSIKKDEIDAYLLAESIVRIYANKEGHSVVATNMKKIPTKNGKEYYKSIPL